MKTSDWIVPGVITVFSCVVIYLSLQLDLSPPMIVGHSMQPRAFPIFLMVINLILIGLLTYQFYNCLLYTSPSPRDLSTSRMPSSA